jgi:C4-dicarboxylate transporter, DctM subunit
MSSADALSTLIADPAKVMMLAVALAVVIAMLIFGFNRVLNRLEETLIAVLIAGATLLIFVAVVHRYGTGLSIDISKWATAHELTGLAAVFKSIFLWFSSWDLSWSQELCVIMFVWMAKFGAAYGVRTGVHVGVDVATNAIKPSSRYWVVLFGLVCGAIFTFTIGTFGATFVGRMLHTGQVTNDLEAPQWIVYLAIPLGSYLMCFRFLQVIAAFARTGELPHTDESHVEGLPEVSPVTEPGHHEPATVSGGAR